MDLNINKSILIERNKKANKRWDAKFENSKIKLLIKTVGFKMWHVKRSRASGKVDSCYTGNNL